MLLIDSGGNLGCLAKKVKVFADRDLGYWPSSIIAEGVLVEDVIRVVQTATETVIRIFELKAGGKISLTA